LQKLLIEEFDREFKRYILEKGVNVDTSMFDLSFQPPQNFAAYRQAELDTTRANWYGALGEVPYLSKRFAMKRYLGLTEEEIKEKFNLSDEYGHYYIGPILRSPSMGARPNLVYEYKGFTPGFFGWRMTKKN